MPLILFLKAKRPDARGTDDMFAALTEQAVQVRPHYDKHGRFIPGHTSMRRKRAPSSSGPKLPTRKEAVSARVPDLFAEERKKVAVAPKAVEKPKAVEPATAKESLTVAAPAKPKTTELRYDPTRDRYNGEKLTRGDIFSGSDGNRYTLDRAMGFMLQVDRIEGDGKIMPGKTRSISVDPSDKDRYMGMVREGANIYAKTKAFTPTHEAADGTPLAATAEAGVYVDADGFEVEDEYAKPLKAEKPKKAKADATHAAVAARLGIPEDVVRNIATEDPATMIARTASDDKVPNNGEVPAEFDRYPIGSVRMADFGGDHENRYIDYLRTFDPNDLVTAEAEQGIKQHPTYGRYLQWSREGKEAPYITVYQTDGGKLQSTNRRRTLVAQEVGKPVTGWFGPHNPETKSPLKYGDVMRAIKEEKAKAETIGPKEGERNAQGLVFRSGRWHRDEEKPTQPVFPVEESKRNAEYRANRGDEVMRIDAKAFADAYLRDKGEPLLWKPGRADNIRELLDSGTAVDEYPKVGVSADGKVDVGDGRHRIAVAAERGMMIDVAAPKEHLERLRSLIAKPPATDRLRQSLPPDAPPAITEAIGKVESSQHNLAALHEAKAPADEIKEAAEELKAVTAELSDGIRSWQDKVEAEHAEDKMDLAEALRDAPDEPETEALIAKVAERSAEKKARDTFSLDRMDAGAMKPQTFERGESVKVSGKRPMIQGVITGISHAEGKAKVGSVWYPFGYIYKQDYDEFAKDRKKIDASIAALSARIDSGNTIDAVGIIDRIRSEAKLAGLTGYADTLGELEARASRVGREQMQKIKAADEKRAAAGAAASKPTETKPVESIKMTMDEWKKIHRDYKGKLPDGRRATIRGGGLVPVEIVKEAIEPDGPREGDRNAEGLVFRDGRWHRDDAELGLPELMRKYHDLRLERYRQKGMYNPEAAAEYAAKDKANELRGVSDDHAKDVLRQDIEDLERVVAEHVATKASESAQKAEPKTEAIESTLTPKEQQALTHAENMVKPGVVAVASKLRNDLKISGTLQAMVAMSTGKIPEAADLTTQERATAAWMAEHSEMTHRDGRRESAERPGWIEYYDVPVTMPSEVSTHELQDALFDAVGLDKSAPYYTPGFSDHGLIAAAIQIDTEKHRTQLSRLAATVKQWVEKRSAVERGKRLLSGSSFTDPATWGEKAKVMAEVVADGLLDRDHFERALERDMKIQPALKKEIPDGAPTLDEILSGSRSLNDLIALRLVGSTNQAKINAYVHDLQRLRAILTAIPAKPDGKQDFDAESNAYRAAGFTYLRNHTSAFNRKKVYAVQTPSGGIIELGLMSFSGDMNGLFKLPKEPGGWHVDLKSRASAIMTFLAESGYLRKASEEEVKAAEPKPARPAPVRKEIAYKRSRETKETRKPAHLFYGTPTSAEIKSGNPEIAKRMREDIKAGVAAGRIPKGMKISVTSDHNSIDIRVAGVPKGMPTHNPDWLVAYANHGWNLEYAAEEVAREIGKMPRDIPRYSPELTRVLDDVKAIHGKYNWDKSDAMTDYYSRNYYGDASVNLDAELDVVPKPASAKLGDTITLDGNTYRLEGDPPRWHKVRGQDPAKAAASQETDASRKARASKVKARAEKAIADAEAEIGRDRRANTPKRAREAASMIGRAMHKQSQAETLFAIGEAIEAGDAVHLGKVSSLADVETLDKRLRDARHLHMERAGVGNYTQRNERMGEAPDPDAINYAFYPRVNREHSEWGQEATVDEQARLRRLGITDDASLRAALTEYLGVRSGPKKEDPVKVAERAMVGKKVGVDFFPTPKPLAAKMAQMAGIKPGMRVLEPSAGNGHLADAARAAGAQVDTVEISDTLRNILSAKGHPIVAHDFMAMDPAAEYDAIVMNPPFSKRMDAEHIRRAWEHLKPGGTLVAITGEGVHFGKDAKAADFRDWLDEHGADVERLPENTFKGADLPVETGVNARIIIMQKPAEMSKAILFFAPSALPKVARITKLKAQH